MHLSYLDESGDPGTLQQKNTQGVSDYFLITNLYLPETEWKEVFVKMKEFRKNLNQQKEVNFLNIEFHAREFVQARSPYYRLFGKKILNRKFRVGILLDFCRFLGQLNTNKFKIITTAVSKNFVQEKGAIIEYTVKENLTRMWLDIGKRTNNFLVISDQGREDDMVRAMRKIQVFNPVNGYDNKLDNMIEDCLFKDSAKSYFLQSCDLVAYLSFLWLVKDKLKPKFLQKYINTDEIEECFSLLEPILNQRCNSGQNKKAIKIFQ